MHQEVLGYNSYSREQNCGGIAGAADSDVVVVMKQCRRCGETRPASEFHRQQSRPDGLYSYCIYCASEYKLERKLNRCTTDASTSQVAALAHWLGPLKCAMAWSQCSLLFP